MFDEDAHVAINKKKKKLKASVSFQLETLLPTFIEVVFQSVAEKNDSCPTLFSPPSSRT